MGRNEKLEGDDARALMKFCRLGARVVLSPIRRWMLLGKVVTITDCGKREERAAGSRQ